MVETGEQPARRADGSGDGPASASGAAASIGLWAVLLLLALLPVMALSGYAVRVAGRSMEAALVAAGRESARITAELMQRDLAARVRLAESFAALPAMRAAVRDGDEAAARALLAPLVESHPRIDRAFLSDPEGLLWSDYPHAPESVGENFAFRDWYRGVSQNWQPYVSDVYRRHAEPQPLVVAVAVPVREGDAVAGILVCQVRIDDFSDLLRDIAADGEGFALVLDPTGTAAAHPWLDPDSPLDRTYADVPFVVEARAGRPASGRYPDPLLGMEMVATFKPVPVGGRHWVVAVQDPAIMVDAPTRRLRAQISAAATVLALAALGLAVVLGRFSDRTRRLGVQVRRQVGELREQADHLVRINAALTASQTELRVARDLAESANRAKSEFLANMSHELRTPLNVVIGYSELIRDDIRDAGTSPDLDSDLQRIRDAGRQLLALVNDVLDLSKIEAGRMEPHLETFDLATMLHEVARTAGPLMEANRNRLEVRLSEPLGEMTSDLTWVRQILFNLLSNAAKFTQEGEIELGAERIGGPGDEWVEIRVRDTGIGIAPDRQEQVFEPFTQADSATTRRYGGTGLGLTISRRLCEGLGGQIRLDSALARGSTFTVRLPARLAGPAGKASPAAASAGSPPSPDPGPGAETVLVIDDDPDAADLIGRILSRDGYRVVTASSGAEGIRLARTHRPAAITLDVMMPGMDGWAVLSALKSDPDLARIPVIMETIVNNRDLGYALGASDYLVKPVDRTRLLQALRRHARGGLSVLVVDSDPTTRAAVRQALEQEGCAVEEAADGRGALEILGRTRPSLVLLDLVIPDLDGFGLLEAIRSGVRFPDLPVVAMTADDLSPEERARLENRVLKVVEKSAVSRDVFLDQIRSLVAQVAGQELAAPPGTGET